MIGNALSKALPGVVVTRLEDGIVLYRTSASVEQVQGLRFFQNTFLVLAMTDVAIDDPVIPVIKALRETDGWEQGIAAAAGRGKRTWRAIASVQNEPTAIPTLWKQKLEKIMSGVPSLEPGSADADLTFWVLSRREGFGFFGLRLTRRDERTLSKGELRPEIAHLLCVLSDPKPGDVFLDPFSGSGAIPAERVKTGPYRKILAGDADESLAIGLRKRFSGVKHVETGAWDATTLSGIPDASVDAIVTDPPWGKFEKGIDTADLYPKTASAFARVLRPGGRLVLLTSRDDHFENALPDSLKTLSVHDVLISGQKARIHMCTRS